MWKIARVTRTRDELYGERTPGADALRAFRDVCETGPAGRYELRAWASLSPPHLVLATARVRAHEMDITWKRGLIFFALGLDDKLAEVAKVEQFLAKEGV